MAGVRSSAKKKIAQVDVDGKAVEVVMMRHHWSRQLRLSVSRAGAVRLSLPERASWQTAEDFLRRSSGWLSGQVAQADRAVRRQPTRQERRQARELVMVRLAYWQTYFMPEPQKIRIGNQTSRWGSCSPSGTLSFNWRLIELEPELADYIIVHELAHLVHANHSPVFWAEVERVLPGWRSARKALRQHSLILD